MPHILNYERDSSRWPLRYFIGTAIIAVCHLLVNTSYALYATYYLAFTNENPLWFMSLPMNLIPDGTRAGLPLIDASLRNFFVRSVMNAVIWGLCGIGLWHGTSYLKQRGD
jgi:hypothetical protein